MAKQNKINRSTQDLTIDPGASGDSFVQFDINGTGEFRIGVDDTDDSFRVSQGSALGTNDTFVVSSDGELTMPLQPAFLAYLSATATNVTGDNTAYDILFDTEVFDVTSDYNTATGTFTAPITARYSLGTAVSFVAGSGGGASVYGNIITSNGSYSGNFLPSLNYVANFYGVNNAVNAIVPAVADMDAADTALYRIQCGTANKVDDIYGGAACYTYFYGYLAV